jgi:hypothetical protein
MDNENDMRFWKSGFGSGEESVFAFLQDMTFIDTKRLLKHYKAWSIADEYTTVDGIKVDRCK